MDNAGTALGRLAVTATLRAGVVLAGFAAAIVAASAAWGAPDVALSLAGPEGGGLTVEGSVSGVRPGGPSTPLRLTLRNTGDGAVRVTRVTAGPAGPGPRCAPGALAVAPWTGSLTVPARGSVTVTTTVRLAAGSTCPGWTLYYTAH